MPRTIATTTTVQRDELLEFVRPRHQMVLLTARSDGPRRPRRSPAASTTWARRDLHLPGARQVRQRPPRPRRRVLVLSDDFGGAWVQIDGTAEVLDLPDAVDPLVDYYRCIAGEHPDWDEYRRAMAEQGKSPDPHRADALVAARDRRLPGPPRLIRKNQLPAGGPVGQAGHRYRRKGSGIRAGRGRAGRGTS